MEIRNIDCREAKKKARAKKSHQCVRGELTLVLISLHGQVSAELLRLQTSDSRFLIFRFSIFDFCVELGGGGGGGGRRLAEGRKMGSQKVCDIGEKAWPYAIILSPRGCVCQNTKDAT